MGYTNSGQVFTEVVVSTKVKDCTCAFEYLNLKPIKKTVHNKSTPSLQDMLIRKLLDNLDILDMDALRTFPFPPTEKFWAKVRTTKRDSLRTWVCFAQSDMRNRGELVHNCRCPCVNPRLSVLLNIATSPSVEWLASVTVCNNSVTAYDMLRFKEMVNLQSILIYGSRVNRDAYSDYVFRLWAQAASESGSFSKLETIFVNGCPDLTRYSLSHLSSFPALHTFCVQQCGKFRERSDLPAPRGWTRNRRGGFCSFASECRLKIAYNHGLQYFSDLADNGVVATNDFNTIAQSYIHHRRAAMPSELPSLSLSIVAPNMVGMCGNREDITCYEKDLEVTEPDVARTWEEELREPPAKKQRVIKSAKSLHLRDVLGEM